MIATPAPLGVREWFLEEPRWWLRSPLFRKPKGTIAGVPFGQLVECLRFVYSERVVVEMVETGYWPLIFGLTSGGAYVESLGTMLAIGLDLVATPELPEDDEIIRHLRLGEHFPGARLELGCWAGLRRNGFRPRRPHTTQKQPDFIVDTDTMAVAVECKTLSNGSEVENTRAYRSVFENRVVTVSAQGPARAARLQMSAEGQARTTANPERFRRTLLPEFEAALDHALGANRPDGSARGVGDFGTLTLRYDEDRWLDFDYADNVALRLKRISQQFDLAATKFIERPSDDQFRLAVVQAADDYIEDTVLTEFLGNRVAQLQNASHLDAGLLLSFNSRGMEPGWTQLEAFFRTPGSDRTRPPARFLRALSAWQRHVRLPRPA